MRHHQTTSERPTFVPIEAEKTQAVQEECVMRRRISPRCLILLGIILGVCSLTHTSSSAQGTSASRDKEEFAKRMGSHLQLLKECEDSESRVEKNQKELEKAYQVVYEKCDALRKYYGKASEAWREYEVASYASPSSAVTEFRMNDYSWLR